MEEKLNLHIYPLRRLKVYSEPNQIDVKLKTLRGNNYFKEHEQSNVFDYQTKAINYPYMIYDSINSNILHEIKTYYGSDKLYDIVKLTDPKNPETNRENIFGHDKEYDDIVGSNDEDVNNQSKLGNKEKKGRKKKKKKKKKKNI